MSLHAKPLSIRLSAIVHATEDSEKVLQAIRNICRDTGSSEPSLNRTKGHHGNQIATLVITIRNQRIVERCLHDLWKHLSELDRTEILSSMESRVNESGTLFLRIDKQSALKGILRLQDADPVKIVISFNIAGRESDLGTSEIRRTLTEIPDHVGE